MLMIEIYLIKVTYSCILESFWMKWIGMNIVGGRNGGTFLRDEGLALLELRERKKEREDKKRLLITWCFVVLGVYMTSLSANNNKINIDAN